MSAANETVMKSCDRCGARIPSDSKYCEDCGRRLSETLVTPIAPHLAPKPRRLSIKTTVAALVLVCMIVLVLIVPWIPVVRSGVVREQFTYSYTYPVTEERAKRELVFSSGNVTLKAFKSPSQSDYYWASRGFLLEKGWAVQLRLRADNYAWVTVYVKGGWLGDTYYSTSSQDGTFMVPKSGEFRVVFQNLDPDKGHTVSVELTAEWTEIQHVEETVTQTVTFDVTRYNVTYVSLIDLLLRQI